MAQDLAPRFRGRSFLSLADYTAEELNYVLDLADELKRERKGGKLRTTHAGKTLALLFQKPSLRTRVSFDLAIAELGGRPMYLGPDEIGLGKRETVEDVAVVLSRYVHGIEARVFGHNLVEELAKYATVPVVNGLSDLLHPCQGLADYMTVRERFGKTAGLRLAFVGDGNNVANSLMLGGGVLGCSVTVICPKGYEPPAAVVTRAKDLGAKSGAAIEITNDLAAAHGADILYTDVWASMGQESQADKKKNDFAGFTIDMNLLKKAAPGAIVMHCLPAHYGDEITHEVAYSPQSAIWDEAENRLHAQKAILALVM